MIGGINLDNLKSVLDAGAESVCMISAIIGKDDVEKEVRKVKSFFRIKNEGKNEN